jgi:hypothetical protein
MAPNVGLVKVKVMTWVKIIRFFNIILHLTK